MRRYPTKLRTVISRAFFAFRFALSTFCVTSSLISTKIDQITQEPLFTCGKCKYFDKRFTSLEQQCLSTPKSFSK